MSDATSPDAIFFVVDGTPVPKGRPKFSKIGHAYTPEATRNYEELGRRCAREAMGERAPLDGYLWANIEIHLPVPDSFSKKKAASAIAGIVRPVGRSDIDNFIKVALDFCNGIVWKDDRHVVGLTAAKYYSAVPRLQIEASQIPTESN